MARKRNPKNSKSEKKVTRYTYGDVKEPRTPETGHTPLLPAEEQVVTFPMDNKYLVPGTSQKEKLVATTSKIDKLE